MLWTKKYAPKTLDGVAGNDEAREELLRWAREFERGKVEKPLILHGPPGVGKTLCAEALALQMGWGLIEANASDLRDAETMNKIFGLGSSSMGLLGGTRLLLIDEIDSAFDRGEFQAITSIIKESKQPIIFTANDLWEQKIAPIRLQCRPIEFKKVNAKSAGDVLKRIAKAEGVDAGEGELERVSKNAGGDVRAAILDFQAACTSGGQCLVATSEREREKGIFDAVRETLKAATYADASRAMELVDEEPSGILLWIEENVPAEYEDAEEVAKAFDCISRADIYLGRVRKTRDWGFLKFARPLMTAGVALSKKQKYYKFSKYSFPSGIRVLSSNRKSRELLKSAALKAGAKTHSSSKEAKKSTMPFLFRSDEVRDYFGLSEEEFDEISKLYAYGRAKERKKK